ncbi:MAG: YraN family protein, partial [Eubacteriales bacterium]
CMNLGKKGEEIACKYLESKNYRVLERNYRLSFGEIDLIATHGKTVVFVEVKTRMNMNYGLPGESITANKIHSIEKVANFYISQKGFRDWDFRIDAVEILIIKGKPYIRHLENITG